MPRTEPTTVALSPLEEERFGIRTSRVNDLAAADVPLVLRACADLGVELLIARCPATDLAAAQALEAAGAGLMDTLVYYARDLSRNPPAEDPATKAIRLVRPGEEDEVASVAAESFRGYSGHYHADPRLERKKCDEVYTSWSRSACVARDERSDVLVLPSSEGIDAFATMRMNRPEEGEGVLFGVLPRSQGRGIYRLLILRGMAWCRDHGARTMVVSTQITNLAVQKVWVRAGFEPSGAYYTFHLWFQGEQKPR